MELTVRDKVLAITVAPDESNQLAKSPSILLRNLTTEARRHSKGIITEFEHTLRLKRSGGLRSLRFSLERTRTM
jgi:hypothetical protein